MVRLFVFAFLAIGITSCGCFGPAPNIGTVEVTDKRIYEPHIATLYQRFRDGDDRYLHRFVKVDIVRKSYRVTDNPPSVEWSSGSETDPPAIVFDVAGVTDNDKTLTVIGFCVGRVKHRSGKTVVRVINCTVGVVK